MYISRVLDLCRGLQRSAVVCRSAQICSGLEWSAVVCSGLQWLQWSAVVCSGLQWSAVVFIKRIEIRGHPNTNIHIPIPH